MTPEEILGLINEPKSKLPKTKHGKRKRTRELARREEKEGKELGRYETRFWQNEFKDLLGIPVHSKNDREDQKWFYRKLKEDRQYRREEKRTGRSKLAIKRRDKRKNR